MVIKPEVHHAFILQGSVIEAIWHILCGNLLVSTLSTYVYFKVFNFQAVTSHVPFLLIGGGLGIYLAFRNNSCYDRYWEGRKLCGALFVNCLNMQRQLKMFIKIYPGNEEQNCIKDIEHLERHLVHLLISFSHSTRLILRDQPLLPELNEWLPKDVGQELIHNNPVNFPFFLLNEVSRDLRVLWIKGWITDYQLVEVQSGVKDLTLVYASCMRIKTTPVPFPYTQLVKVATWLYCFLLPIGLVTAVGVATPVVSVIVAYLFFGLDAVSDQLEQPFGLDNNDLPLNFFTKNIEVELLRGIGEHDLPKVPVPVNNILL